MMNKKSIQNKLLALAVFSGLSLALMAVTSQGSWQAASEDHEGHDHSETAAPDTLDVVDLHADEEAAGHEGHDHGDAAAPDALDVVDLHADEEVDSHAGHNHAAQSFGPVTLEHLMEQ